MQFFEVTDDFLLWLLSFAVRRPILDVGCGEGQLLEALMLRTHKCRGIDRFQPESQRAAWNCQVADAAEAPLVLQEGWLLVIARPGPGLLVTTVLARAASEVLILARQSGVEDPATSTGFAPDLEQWATNLKKIEVPGLKPTLGGEPVCGYLYTPPEIQGDWKEYQDHGWLRKLGRSYEYPSGRRAYDMEKLKPTGKQAVDVRCIEPDPDDRAIHLPVHDHPGQHHGWVTPWGRIFTCEYFQHDELIHTLGLTTHEAELMGWKRTFVMHNGAEPAELLFCDADPSVYTHKNFYKTHLQSTTNAQYKALEHLQARFNEYRKNGHDYL